MPDPSAATVHLIRRLVSFDTTSRDSNLGLIEFVRGYLADLGIESRLVPDATGRKANLFATIGPADRPGLILAGHTDVVPVDGQDWATDPFTLTERDGRLYGRGSTDMKSFLAVVLAAAPRMAGADLKVPIHLAFSYDEEVGCLGVRRLIAEMQPHQPWALACIIGEPTEMNVVRAHKGKLSVRCRVRGKACHSSTPHLGVNAVEIAAELVSVLRHIGRRLAWSGLRDPGFDPPYTTAHVGKLHGGIALNIVPQECSFDFEFRHLPQDSPDGLLAELRLFAEEEMLPEMLGADATTGIDWEELSRFPGLDQPEDSDIVRLALAAAGANASGKIAFGTEGGLYQAAGIPTIICGPGSVGEAHKPNESIALDQVAACEAFLARLIDRLSAGDWPAEPR